MYKRAHCYRTIAYWFEGTKTGWLFCGEDTTSITVHN
jgi:hypothetical protein